MNKKQLKLNTQLYNVNYFRLFSLVTPDWPPSKSN